MKPHRIQQTPFGGDSMEIRHTGFRLRAKLVSCDWCRSVIARLMADREPLCGRCGIRCWPDGRRKRPASDNEILGLIYSQRRRARHSHGTEWPSNSTTVRVDPPRARVCVCVCVCVCVSVSSPSSSSSEIGIDLLGDCDAIDAPAADATICRRSPATRRVRASFFARGSCRCAAAGCRCRRRVVHQLIDDDDDDGRRRRRRRPRLRCNPQTATARQLRSAQCFVGEPVFFVPTPSAPPNAADNCQPSAYATAKVGGRAPLRHSGSPGNRFRSEIQRSWPGCSFLVPPKRAPSAAARMELPRPVSVSSFLS